MKIGNTTPARPLSSVSRTSTTSRPAAAPAGGVGVPNDVATVMGIPEAELTPKVRAALGQLMSEVQRLRDDLEQARKRIGFLEELSDQDPLVPIINRRAFVRELTRFTAFAERYGSAGSVLYFDVNGMKQVNDSLGHAAGDAALKHVAETLLAHIRASDIVGRLGGDEFGVILAQADTPAAEIKAAELATAITETPMLWDGKEIVVKVAYGVHPIASGQEVDEALHAADQAMYAHKRAKGIDRD